MMLDKGSRALLVGLFCLTMGKFAYYGIERAVRPAPQVKPPAVRVKAQRTPREALNLTATETKTDLLR